MPRMAPRRRNPKGGRHFAEARESTVRDRVKTVWIGRRLQSAGHDAASIFQQPAKVRKAEGRTS